MLFVKISQGYGDCLYNPPDENGILNLTDDVILESHYAGCNKLITLNLLPGVKSVGAHAFHECLELQTVNIATSVKNIDDGAFSNSSQLNTINIPFGTKVGVGVFDGIQCSTRIIKNMSTPGRRWDNCTPVRQFNYNSKFFVVPAKINLTCEELCYQNRFCQGYIESLASVIPYQCMITTPDTNIDVAQNLNELKENFTGFQQLNCSTYTAQDVCFSETKSCISCPEFPDAWQEQVESGYTIHFLSACCSDRYHAQFTDPIPTIAVYNTSFVIEVNNLKFVSHPNVFIQTEQCPMFTVDTQIGIDNIEFNTMQMKCTNTTSQTTAILIEYTRKIQITAENMKFTDVLSGITVLGGSQNKKTIFPSFSTTDLSNSRFSNISILSDINPAVSAISLASYTGENIQLGDFDSHPLIVIQPGINDNNIAPNFTILNINNTKVRIFNISAFTQIFGVEYEISFSHAGAFETDEEAVSLRRLILYQVYIMIALFSLLLLLHQDLMYYYKENANANKKIQSEIMG
jgi:hypothetical protein